jgi:hypothetical protein
MFMGCDGTGAFTAAYTDDDDDDDDDDIDYSNEGALEGSVSACCCRFI